MSAVAVVARRDAPGPLPPDAMNRVRMVAEVAFERDVSPREREPRVRDAVGIGNERIRSMGTHIARRARGGGRRPQDVDAAHVKLAMAPPTSGEISTRAGPAARDRASVILPENR